MLAAWSLPPFFMPWLPVVLAVLFLLVARSQGPKDAFIIGAGFALGLFALHVLWLPRSFAAFFGLAFWLLQPLLLAVLAVMWGATVYAVRLITGGGRGALAVLPFAWVTVEWLRSLGPFGFPWGTLGYATLETPLAQAADTIGVHGLSLFLAVLASLLAWPFASRNTSPASRNRGGWAWAAAAVWLVAGLGLGLYRTSVVSATMEAADTRSALLVQPNVDPFGRTQGPVADIETHFEVTERALLDALNKPDLIVWPEGALIGADPGRVGDRLLSRFDGLAPEATWVVGGRVYRDGGARNAAFAVEDGVIKDRYDKHVLVPFGERFPGIETVPGVYRGVFAGFGLPMLQGTAPGRVVTPLAARTELGAYICYESVFPFVPRRMVAGGATVLVNITNDAWFSKGVGAQQHFDMGRMRAIETRRWMLRAANDGMTASVDPHGQVQRQLPRFERGVLEVSYEEITMVTPFVRHGHLMPWVLLAGLTASLAWAGWSRLRTPLT
jgi:apolipoprotein N-acyltransferase